MWSRPRAASGRAETRTQGPWRPPRRESPMSRDQCEARGRRKTNENESKNEKDGDKNECIYGKIVEVMVPLVVSI